MLNSISIGNPINICWFYIFEYKRYAVMFKTNRKRNVDVSYCVRVALISVLPKLLYWCCLEVILFRGKIVVKRETSQAGCMVGIDNGAREDVAARNRWCKLVWCSEWWVQEHVQCHLECPITCPYVIGCSESGGHLEMFSEPYNWKRRRERKDISAELDNEWRVNWLFTQHPDSLLS